ncbi:MAG: formate dehydrogenase accessory protein FdhE [Nitriliruptorales bacterium]|nr:formate dehydrogenase accessory protein FdhE [Nitriliruptorales bacterium]
MGGAPPPTVVPRARPPAARSDGAGLPRRQSVTPSLRGGPGRIEDRRARAAALAAVSTAAGQPLRLACAVLEHQLSRVDDATVAAAAALAAGNADRNRITGRYPLLELDPVAEPVAAEVPRAVAALAPRAVPQPLTADGRQLQALGLQGRRELVEAWLDDVGQVNPLVAFWIGVAAGPILETAAASITTPDRSEWTGPACPFCGGWPRISVIAEESGEFMAGSPRFLVCGRCAGWWVFARATCPNCREDDPRKMAAHLADGRRGVRLDVCDTCSAYIKTFDLRVDGSADVVPLVDDVASVALDLWADSRGWHRSSVPLAGV